MANFFKHAPAANTEQKRFLDAVANRHNVIATFPLAHPAVSVYAFAAMLGGGLVVVICPNTRHIRRNLDSFQAAGFQFPDIACLDGTQPPHEERAIRKEVNLNRVRLLMTTPERFGSLTFLEVLVHAPVHFILIEEADRFLSITPGHAAYRRLREESLAALKKLPPLALMAPPLAMDRIRELQTLLNMENCRIIRCDPLMDPVEIQVHCLLTEHQKFMRLTDELSRHGDPPESARRTLIQTASPSQAEKLGASLLDYGFTSVRISHTQKMPEEQTDALTQANSILVNAGGDIRYWFPTGKIAPHLIFWSPPAGLDDFLMQVFRLSPSTQTGSAYGGPPDREEIGLLLHALVLYTKEDFLLALRRIQNNPHLDEEELQARIQALQRYRQWILSEECRLRTLKAFYFDEDGTAEVAGDMPSCGRCDRCLAGHRRFPAVQRLLQHFFF